METIEGLQNFGSLLMIGGHFEALSCGWRCVIPDHRAESHHKAQHNLKHNLFILSTVDSSSRQI